MRFHDDFLGRYLLVAPAALALERSIECELHVKQPWPAPILDVGCGDGVFAEILFADKIDTGIDADPEEVARAKRFDKYNELIACPGDRIPKPDGSYNTVFSNSVLEHIPDLMPVLREIHRLMSDEARFYVTIPTDRLERSTFIARVLSAFGLSSLAERYGRFYNRFWKHYNVHDEKGWRALFEEAGFEIEIERAYVPTNLSTVYDLLTPIALPSMIAKKLYNRWILLPGLRRFTAPLLAAPLSAVARSLQKAEGGSLVYYALRKRSQP